MPFDRPALAALRARVRQDIRARVPGTDPLLRRSNLGVLADVEAGLAHLLYGRLAWCFDQVFPDTAETAFLDRWAAIWGVERLLATHATGRVSWPANPGAAIAPGSLATRGDGVVFAIPTGGSESGGEIEVDVAAVDAGVAPNTAPDVEMTLATVPAGVSPLGAVVAPGIAGGADDEADAALRARLLLRIRMPPRGGAASDYVQWALEVAGVTRAWVSPLELGAGTVVVRFMMDAVRASAQGIPESGDVALVQAHINAVRPITADVTVLAPTPLPVDVTIASLDPDTPATRGAIEDELLDLFVRIAEPGGTLLPADLVRAASAAAGVRRFDLTTPASPVTPAGGEIAVLGTVSWT